MQVWNAFAGYRDIYGTLPSARLVMRVRLYLAARNQKNNEDAEQQRKEIEDQRREMDRNKARYAR